VVGPVRVDLVEHRIEGVDGADQRAVKLYEAVMEALGS
jgi:hypothetical protein